MAKSLEKKKMKGLWGMGMHATGVVRGLARFK